MRNPISVSELLLDGHRNNYAVAAMNANGATYDIARAILEAADEENTPVVVQAYEHNIGYRGFEYFVQLVKHLAEHIRVPYAIALDHGTSVDSIMQAVLAGFTGVMLDNTVLPLDEYVKACSDLVRHLSPVNVSFEAEVGRMAPQEQLERGTLKTDAASVVAFLERAQVDLVAVSIGTSHGIHEVQDQLDYDLIREINSQTDTPLVLHGTSGVPLDLITRAVAAGMRKINFGEGFRVDYIGYYKKFAQESDHQGHTWRIMQEVKDALKADMKEILRAVSTAPA